MIGNYSARLTGSKRNLLALMASSVIFSAGCANMTSTAPAGNSLSSPATLSGKVHGGNQPVVGATVTLWYMGQTSGSTGGTPATKGATTTTDSLGSFSFTKGTGGDGTTSTYTCPTNVGDPLVYVVSQGGNTQNNGGSSTNSAAAFIALYGSCASLSASNFVYMSEVTTVATMATVQQFFNPANDTLSADGTGQQRIIVGNLPNTVALLASASTGLGVSSTVIPASTSGDIASTVTLTATPEAAKVNTLANIISACVNGATSADPNCSALFTAAVPPAGNVTNLNPSSPFPTATDTLQALFYIFTNPTNGSTTNLGNLFALSPSTGAAYQPTLSSAPTDWTIGINYASSSTCGTSSGGTGSFISSPTDINVDDKDNVWFGNAQTGGNLSSISSAGAPLTCVNLDAGLNGSGGTIDSAGNVWSAGPATLYRYNPTTRASLAFPTTVGPLAITADGVGNVYFTAVAGTTGSLYQLPGAATASAAVLPVQISSTVGAAPLHLMPDFTGAAATLGNIWVISGTNSVAQVSPSTANGNLNGFVTTSHTTSGTSSGLSITRPGGIYVSSNNSSVIDYGIPPSYSSASGFPFSAPATAGINGPLGIASDGRLNLWITNANTASISQISQYGGALSPSTGFQKSTSYFNNSTGTAVDQAGNVWVIGTGNNFVTEVVGEGVPIYAPYAVGLLNGRFQGLP